MLFKHEIDFNLINEHINTWTCNCCYETWFDRIYVKVKKLENKKIKYQLYCESCRFIFITNFKNKISDVRDNLLYYKDWQLMSKYVFDKFDDLLLKQKENKKWQLLLF